MGTLRLDCVRGCECEAHTIDALLPSQRLATLNTSALRLTQSSACVVRMANVRRADAGCPQEPCSKLKVVALSVSSIDALSQEEVQAVMRTIGAAAAERTEELNTAVGLDFL